MLPDARTLTRWHALGRVAMGTALTVAPARVGSAWIGAQGRRPGVQVLTAAMGARDLGIGAGIVHALQRGADARPWVLAGVLADAADLAGTLRARRHLPPLSAAGVTAMAAGSTVLGLWLYVRPSGLEPESLDLKGRCSTD